MKKLSINTRLLAVLVVFFLLVTGQAFAATYNLTAMKGCISMPGGGITDGACATPSMTSINIWGLKNNATGRWIFEAGQELTVGDGSLTVNLTNNLGVVTSLFIAGQQMTPNNGPVWFTVPDPANPLANAYSTVNIFTGNRPGAQAGNITNLTARMRSLSQEALPAGGTQTYIWPAVKPGTFILMSGTHQSVQVAMGLYGAVNVSGGGYPGVAFGSEVTLLYSEIDPVLNNGVTDVNVGTISNIDFKPRYFLVNGKPFTPGVSPIPAGVAGSTTLVRLANAGLFNHVAEVQGAYFTVRAEDGNIYPVGKQIPLHSILLTAGKTIDATFDAAGGKAAGYFPVFDRRLYTANPAYNAATQKWSTPEMGGLLSYLRVPSGTDATLTVTAATEGPVAAPGAGKVIVASAPGGISCSVPLAAPDNVCGPATINAGTKVTLSAVAVPGSIGRLVPTVPVATCKANKPCEIDVTGSITVNAFFRPLSNVAVYDGAATWYIDKTGSNVWEGLPSDASPNFGFAGAIPVSGDWTGDGLTKIGVYANASWYLDTNNSGTWNGTPTDTFYFFGFPGATPVTGDWNGSGITKVGVYANGLWYLDMNGNGSWDGEPTDKICNFGFAGAVPVAGDWTGTGITKVGIYANANWYLDMDGDCAWDATKDAQYFFGFPGAIPVVSDWNNDGRTKVGVYSNGTWYADINGNGVWDGPATDATYSFGFAGAMPVTGHW